MGSHEGIGVRKSSCENENDLTKHKYLERELFGADDPKR